MRAIMRRIGYKSRVLVVNHALIGLVAGARHEPGNAVNARPGPHGRGPHHQKSRG